MFKKTSGEIPPACLFITFFLAFCCVSFCDDKVETGETTNIVCVFNQLDTSGMNSKNKWTIRIMIFYSVPLELNPTIPYWNYSYFMKFLLPPVGIEILISGSKFSIIRLKSQTREKLNLNFRFYRHAWDIWYLGDLRKLPTDLKVVFYLEKTNILSGDFCENLIHFFHSISFTSKGPRQDWEGQN